MLEGGGDSRIAGACPPKWQALEPVTDLCSMASEGGHIYLLHTHTNTHTTYPHINTLLDVCGCPEEKEHSIATDSAIPDGFSGF